MIRKKLLSLPILLMLVLSVLSVNMTGVSAQDSPYIKVVPEITTDLTLGTNFTVSIYTDYGDAPDYSEYDATGYQFTLNWNPNVLNLTEVTNGDVIVGGDETFLSGIIDNTAGAQALSVGFYGSAGQVTSMYTPFPWDGTLAYATFTVVGEGASNIILGPQTKLYGWNFVEGHEYIIIHAKTMPTHIQHGYFQNVPTVTRDIAVTSVTSPNPVFAGELVDIEVVVENQGDVNEYFDVTARNDTTVIDTKTVMNLLPGATKSLTFTWDTAGVPEGTYTIDATATTVPSETDTTDNTLDTDVTVIVPVSDPVAIITARDASDIGEEETFDGTSSYDPDGGDIISYEWDFDGDFVTDATGAVVTEVFTVGGLYTVTLKVTDSQHQVGYATHDITIEEPPPPYAADLVRWKAKPEAHRWKYSWDVDKNVTLTALAGNLGTNPVNVNITFAILNATGTAGPTIPVEIIPLNLGAPVPISVEIDPYDYGYTGAKIVLWGHVTLKYDSNGDGTPDTDATPKIFRFSVEP